MESRTVCYVLIRAISDDIMNDL